MHILHASEWLKCTWLYIRYRTSVCMHSEMHHLVHTCMFRVQSVMHGHTRNNLAASTHNIHATAPRSCSYNYIFKVLFTAPSWYLFSIGIGHISMFRWYLAPFHVPILRSIIQLVYAVINCIQAMNGTVTLNRSVLQVEYARTIVGYTLYTQYRSRCKRFQLWCKPYSFAMTAGIQCCTLSSAYQYA